MTRTCLLSCSFLTLILLSGCSLIADKPDLQNNQLIGQISELQQQITQLNNRLYDLQTKNQALTKDNEVLTKSLATQTAELNETTESWNYAPAEIKNIAQKENINYLTIDILTLNPNFSPGTSGFFINQSNKLREVKLDKNTKFFNCGLGPDNEATTPDVATDITNFLSGFSKGIKTYFLKITNNVVNTIYQQCLP